MTPFLSGEGADYTDIILTGFGQLCFRTSFGITHSVYISFSLLSEPDLGLLRSLRWSSVL